MKPFQALGWVLLLVLLLSDGTQCRPTQVPVIDVKEELFSVQDSGSNAKSEVTPKNSRPIRGVLYSERSVAQHLKGKKIEAVDASSQGDQQHVTSADAPQRKVNPTARLKIQIIERPKEFKVFVKKAPMKKQSPTDEDMNNLKQLGEIINKAKLKSTDEATLNEDPDAENKIYGGEDDDDEISGSGQEESGGSFDFHDYTRYNESSLSRDEAQKQLRAGKDRHRHQKMKQNHSRTAAGGSGAGILLTLVVTILVLGVISIFFVRRNCCLEIEPNAELESVKIKTNSKRLAHQQSVHKEARINVGKRKSQENRKVLRRLSLDQGASTEKEELAIACSIMCPTIETRKKNSDALHTRTSVRAATSHSDHNGSFEEDIQHARCEFSNAPARLGKLVSAAGDEKQMTQDSKNEAITTSNSPVNSDLQ